jgi:Xaa-Pro aminopeptidase
MTEKQVEKEVYRYFGEHGASGASFGPITVFGKNAGDPHAQVGNNKLKSGDCILIDIGCIYEGYCSDVTRTYAIGKPNAKVQEMLDVVKAAQALALSKIRVGMTGQEVDAIARNYIKKHYYGYNIPHGVGHGVGRQIHEQPMNNQLNDQPLPLDSIVTIEPGIYNEYGGARIEDTVVVKNNGCVILTKKAIK